MGSVRHKVVDYVGKIYGSRTVLGFDRMDKGANQWWYFRCKCGDVKSIQMSQVLNGRQSRCLNCFGESNTGANNPLWRGGRHPTTHGYILVSGYLGHPRGDRRGRILEHLAVMGEYLGRAVELWEEVHHLNGDKSDNRLENLQLRATKHGAGVVNMCTDCGSDRITTIPLT